MRTIQVPVFTFDELSPNAKQTAKDQWAEHFGYCWANEALDSIKALTARFGGRIKHYELDWFSGSYSSMEFDMPDLEPEEIESKLAELGTYNPETLKGHGDCKLTGFCMDEDAIDGFRIAWHKGERELDKLMQAAFDTWIKAAQSDCADFYSNTQFSEHCQANGYEFNETGKIV